MTIWCNACQCYVRTPCTSHHVSEDQRSSSFCRRFRSTKGASKARRDQINNEIRNMRALLPIMSDDQDRLSYLHSMAAICTYIKKSVLFQGLMSKEESKCSLSSEAFLQALHGFILVTTAQGRLVCVSENVVEYLGISMVDVLQGDSLFDMMEPSDIDVVKSNLDFDSNSSPERSFVCSMQTSKAFKLQNGGCGSMLVRASFQYFPLPSSSSSSSTCPVTEPLFVALCTPTVDRLRTDNSQYSHSFTSLHRLDMSFIQVSDGVLYYLGYSSEELEIRSWYSLMHPEDLSLSAESHKTLVQTDDGSQLQMVLRLQCKDLSWVWIYIRANKEPQSISCTNYIISETEARFLQQKINSDAFGPSDLCHSSTAQPTTSNHKTRKCLKRQRTSSSQGEELCARSRRRDSWIDQSFVACDLNQEDSSPGTKCESPNLFTPPYTPTSSASSFSHDFLMDVLSSPEASPSYFSFSPVPPTCGQSPSQSPPSLPPVQPLDHVSLASLPAPSPLSSSSLSPSYDDFTACTSDARLVPDCLSVSCESPVECTLHQDDYNLLDQPQGGSVVQHVPDHALPIHPSLLTPSQSPTSQGTFEYSEREREEISILAQQISSLASSFDMFRTLSPIQNTQTRIVSTQHSPCSFSHLTPLSGFKSEPILDDCIFDSILNDLDLATIKTNSRNLSCQMQQQPSAPFGASLDMREPADQLTPGRINMDQNNGLHQLNHYIPSLQQDGLAEENLY
ncbi:neuronal PAS domain-containing protein 4-like [Periophthalmus magnuspinnatus]|uniref:neuronal PAS domain-containing protein 4-like n=1 Tax=Periophthalmus magnuspinnatus TaxID=409849 RepID=UPI00145BF495|nr:neuronal PAS domain-containing protein 4-like [Periophthalmus magnuspinnatus]